MTVQVTVVLVLPDRRGRRGHVHEFPAGFDVRLPVGVPVVLVPSGTARTPERVAQQAGPDNGDQGAAENAQPAEQYVAGQRGERGQAETDDEDSGGVGGRDGRADGDGVAGTAPAAREVGGHHGLAVPGQQGVPGAQDDRQQDGEQSEGDGEASGGAEFGEAGVETAQPGRRPGPLRPHDRALGGCRTAAGARAEPGMGDAAGAVEQVAGVVPQFLGDRSARYVGGLDRRPVAPDGDLVPSDPARVAPADDAHGGAVGRETQFGPQPALQAAGAQARGTVLVLEPRGVRSPGQRRGRRVGRHPEVPCGPVALLGRPGGALGVVDGAVAVAVDLRLLLEGGDLGGVGDGEDLDVVGVDGEAEVVVEGEVPQRMGACGGCREDEQAQRT